jgi:D-lactate dehydrogenase (cytochrome)
LELVPDERRVTTSESELDRHARDMAYHAPRPPDVVVFPETTAEVAAVLAYANERRVPVVPFGVGTSLEGHVVPVRGGISLDLTRMNEVLAVRAHDLTATVQPGVLRSRLEQRAGEHGLFFPVDPGADATLGGMAATNAGGTTTVRYGGMRNQVLGLEVVLGGGTVIRTGGRVVKSSAGYDLTGVFVGSEGTLGVITELTVRLYGIPDYAVAVRAAFPDVEAACRAAAGMIGAGVLVTRVELLDPETIRAVNAYKRTSYAEAPSLFVEFTGGSEESVAGDLDTAREIADDEGCQAFGFERDPAGRSRLWEARHDAYLALLHGAPGKVGLSTDVCVPVSELAASVRLARAAVEELGFPASIVGHVGDGNYHVLFMLDPERPEDLEAARRLNAQIVEDALARGGTCTGEHGIGAGKMDYLEREHPDLLPLMRGLKRLLDPNGILNPGKVLPA